MQYLFLPALSRPRPVRLPAAPGSLFWIVLVALLAFAALVVLPRPVSAADPGADSPTGRNPRVLWTRGQQAVFNRMVRENHPWWQHLKSNADRSATSNARYGDYGQWGTLAYQYTGDERYAQKAWYQITHGFNGGSFLGTTAVPSSSSNFTREYLMDYVWMYDWLYPALTAAQRKSFIDTLNYWGDCILGKAPAFMQNGQPVYWFPRYGDSDNTVGHYFGLVFLGLGTAPENPRAAAFLKDAAVGGLDATGADQYSNHRNAVAFFVKLWAGGEWGESTEYNLLTLRLLFQGAEGVRLLTGRDPYPEITELRKEVGRAMLQEVTPDLQDSYEWGDMEQMRSVHPPRRITICGLLSGMLQDDPVSGPFLHQMTEELAAKHPLEAFPWPPFFVFYNPYSAQADWRTELPKGHWASGIGLSLFHDRRAASGSLFGAHMVARTFCDHEPSYFGTFQLYRKGEWAVTHPVSYGCLDGEHANSMLIGGLSSMRESRGPVAQEFGPNEEYAYLAGTTKGQFYEQPYWNPPPTFLHEWTRSTFYLPSADAHSDTIVVFDRVNAENPKALPSFDRYYQWDHDRIAAAPALKQWLLHAQTRPTATGNGAAWATAGGQQVRLTTLLPASAKQTIVDEDAEWPDSYGYPVKSEQKWGILLVPAQEQQWDTFLNVVQVSDSGTALKNTLLRSAGGEAQGVLLQRAGHPDTLVLFGAVRTARLLAAGYSVTWTSATARTEVFLADLDPARKWSATVDGVAAADLTVSSQGIGHLRTSGAAGHTLKLVAAGQQVDTTPPAVPTGLKVTAGDAKATASWSASTESDLAGYTVWRSETETGGYSRQNSQPLAATQLTQTGLTNGKTYWYRLTAVDTAGNESAASAPVSATPTGAAPPPPPPATYAIRGKVSAGGSALAGVTITAGNKTASSGADGTYSISGLEAGACTVSAAKDGYTFDGPRSLTLSADASGIDFTGTRVEKASSFSISGKVTADGQPVSGATVGWYSANGKKTTTAADGTYTLSGFEAGTYTLWASRDGYDFPDPVTATVGPDGTGVDFTGHATGTVSGTVTWNGAPVEGVTVGIYGPRGKKTTTAADGTYTLTGFAPSIYTVRAEKAGYGWASQTVTLQTSVTCDFDGPSGFVIAGTVVKKGKGVPGVTVSVKATTLKAVTAKDGSYRIGGLAAGTYTVLAKKRGIRFPSRKVTVGPSQTAMRIASR